MNILFISPSFYPATYYGGPIYSTYDAVRALAELGLKVFISTTDANIKNKLAVPSNKYFEVKKNLFIKYYSHADKNGFSPIMFLSLWNDIRKTDIIFLISVFSPSTPLTVFLAKIFKKHIILSPRGQLGEWCLKQGNRFKKVWLLLLNESFKKIIWDATSEQEKKMILKVFPSAEVVVIPATVDVSDFNQEGERNFAIYNKFSGKDLSENKILISMGRLHKIKGFDILINAFYLLKERLPELVLLIAGEDFGEKKNLEEQIRRLNLEERVFLTGNIGGKEKTDFLMNADLFVMSSHHENFGIVYAEAMAAGLPVIASRNTPWQDVEKYNCGLWVENSPEAFAEAILKILDSDLKKMGERGRNYVSEKFNPNVIARDYLNLFNSLLNKANA